MRKVWLPKRRCTGHPRQGEEENGAKEREKKKKIFINLMVGFLEFRSTNTCISGVFVSRYPIHLPNAH